MTTSDILIAFIQIFIDLTICCVQMVMQLQKLRSEHCQQIPAIPLAIPSNQVSHDTGALVGLGAIVHPSGDHVLPGGSIKDSLSQDVVVLPISAVEAGILPPSEGSRSLMKTNC